MHAMVNMALRAGRRAGQIMLRAMDRIDVLTVEEKARNDFVSEIDQNAEAAIIDILHTAYPHHGIVGEESGEAYPEGEYTWIIDPLDGTTNYLHSIPHFCVSIALQHNGRLEHGVIIDPVRNEEFTVSRGKGAQLNGKRIRVSSRHKIEDALLATGIPYGSLNAHLDAYIEMLKAFTSQCRGIRRAGSAALDLAYVAAGRCDGFWEYGLKPWDMAAGTLLVRESGGLVSDLHGGEGFMESGNIVAANPKVFKAMLKEIRPFI
jgi:myo-inositol-1(or 4)-monophosphatase